jgi:UPF0755 protein
MIRRRPILWILSSLLLSLAAAAYLVARWTQEPVATEGEQPPSQVVIIPEGATFQQVAALLERERLIRSRFAFVLLGKAQDVDRRIHPGEYELHAAMRPAEILTKLLTGRVLLHQVTIPEGVTMVQIADTLERQAITDRSEFLMLAKEREFIRSLNIDAGTLEGYLYPDTYRFPRATKAKDVIRAMVGNLWQVFTPELRTRAQEVHLSVHEVLTLASVVEKETKDGQERPLISAVFHNRLRKRIPLQSDPTVIYGLPDFDGNLRKRDLSSPSPYNTYRIRGLPPGPIASPGADAIHAALYPAHAPYLYFVSRNDGTHQFSATLIEHNQAVDKYQRRLHRRSRAGGTFGLDVKSSGAAVLLNRDGR